MRRAFIAAPGLRDAYEYYAREWRGDVADVRIVSPQPDEVNIYFVIEDETGLRLPNTTELAGMAEHMDDETIRRCATPCKLPRTGGGGLYHIVHLLVAESNQRSASEIQSKVTAAVKDFQTWQRKLGRDTTRRS